MLKRIDSALAILQKKKAPSVPVSLTSDQIARATRNRALALVVRAHKTVTAQAIRSQKNRQKALAILQTKKQSVHWKAKLQPPPANPITSSSISDNLNLREMKDQKLHLSWKLPVNPGLALKNTLNKCWFHSTLHFLTCIPQLRWWSLNPDNGFSTFDASLFHALSSIFKVYRPSFVHAFFTLVKDFNGRNNRYGQIAVPDFLDYLCTRSARINQALNVQSFTRLQCSKCSWISEKPVTDLSVKLYLPGTEKFSLQDLFHANSKTVLDGKDAVQCGKCNIKTSHTSTSRLELSPDLLVVEIIRVTSKEGRWMKNSAAVSFSYSNLMLPNFSKKYRVTSTCHHHGNLSGGHWFTKKLTETGWYELNDLKSENLVTDPPGVDDSSVVVLLLIAEDRLS